MRNPDFIGDPATSAPATASHLEGTRIHSKAYVHPGAHILGRVSIGADSSVWPCAVLRGDDERIEVGSRTSIQDGCVVHVGLSPTIIGDQVTVAHSASLHGCTIEDDCIVGIGAIVLDGAIVSHGSIVSAGTLIPPGKIVAPRTVVVGNPFRTLRPATEADSQSIRFAWQLYVKKAHHELQSAQRQIPPGSRSR